MTILEQLAAHARQRVAADREANSLDVLQAQCRALGKGGGEGFQAALAKEGLSFLCEVKKASPSKGVIAKDFPYLDIARAYEAAGARIIGGNNRNLGDFSVNLDNAARLRDRVPPGVLYVAESGVHRPADVAAVRAMGADGVLIGEALMRAKDKSAMLNQFRRSV